MSVPVTFPFGGGINAEDPALDLANGQVSDSLNFLHERGVAVSRPGLVEYRFEPYGGPSFNTGLVAKSFEGSSFYTALVTGVSLYSLDSDLVPTVLTGPVISGAFFTAGFPTIDLINGYIIISGSSDGLVKWDPSGTVYTVNSGAKWQYVVGFGSRAVGAYSLAGSSALLDPRTVGWSLSGDIDTWTGAGSDTTYLSESTGFITGLAALQNMVVVGRTDGLTLGTESGVSNPAFNWQSWSKNASGCRYSGTWAYDNEAVYFVGLNDVHRFNGAQMENIGREIRNRLMGYYRDGARFRGFLSSSVGDRKRKHYHLVPYASYETPHFVYDVEEGRWTEHSYETDIYPYGVGGFYFRQSSRSAPVVGRGADILGATMVLSRWDDAVACERAGYLVTGETSVGDDTQNATADKGAIVVLHNLDSSESAMTVTLNSTLDGSTQSETSANVDIAVSDKWQRALAGVRGAGQFHQVRVDVEANHMIELKRVTVPMETGGEYRG